jgi:dTDP-4-dehydrorhamnose 3,5-epimerase
MRLVPCKISGCYQIYPDVIRDARGSFVKVFHQDLFADHGLHNHFPEVYYSTSTKDVIRGMHFQLPPDDHFKLVYCPVGQVIDVIVDIRVGSPTYGQHQLIDLSSDNGAGVYITKGVAHGFCVVSLEATLIYQVSRMYCAPSDFGIRWDSLGIDWPTQNPILSSRDVGLVQFSEFFSPFHYLMDGK